MSILKAGLLSAVVAATALVGIKPANATFYVFYSTNAGSSFAIVPGSPVPDGQPITSGGTAGGVTILASTFTNNAPNAGTTVPSFTNSTQINASSATGGGIEFAIVENNFQGPTGGQFMLTNAVGLTPNAGVAGSTLTQTSCVLAGMATVTTANVGSLCGTSLSVTAPASVTTTGPSAVANTTSIPLTSLGTPFTTVEYFTLTLAAGANVLAIGSTTLSSVSVPEPMSLALVGSGLVGIGLTRRKRRGA